MSQPKLSARPKTPQSFDREGKAYVGYAIALRSNTGHEIIILAPTIDEAEFAAQGIISFNVDRSKIKRAGLVGEATLNRLKQV